ncbi:MAG: hypothetical protein ABH878_09100, partial [bacterium]
MESSPGDLLFQEIRKICRRRSQIGIYPLESLQLLCAELVKSLRWDKEKSFLLCSIPAANPENLSNWIGALPVSRQVSSTSSAYLWDRDNLTRYPLLDDSLMLVAFADRKKAALLIALPDEEAAPPMLTIQDTRKYRTLITDSPAQVKRVLDFLTTRWTVNDLPQRLEDLGRCCFNRTSNRGLSNLIGLSATQIASNRL